MLLLLLKCRQQGFEVGRYISLERLIEQCSDVRKINVVCLQTI
jgi:hypothetical protein